VLLIKQSVITDNRQNSVYRVAAFEALDLLTKYDLASCKLISTLAGSRAGSRGRGSATCSASHRQLMGDSVLLICKGQCESWYFLRCIDEPHSATSFAAS
jgi:hypothetical protein